jgi:hypothetical protein
VSATRSATVDPITLGPQDLNYGAVFGIGAGVNASWVLSSVTVDYTPAVVPLPAGGVLMLTALGGLALSRRAKRRS